jgi:hypothetical protein
VNPTYFKTRKGQEEIEGRSGGLTPRARRLLIMIDGKRDLSEVGALIADPNLDETLAMLEREGYVAPVNEAAAPPAAIVADAGDTTAAADAPAAFDPKQFDMARNFMMNTITKFNGPYNKLGLIKKVHESSRPEDLRGLFDEWLRAICETRMGKLRAGELKVRLRAVLDGAG